MQDWLKWLGKYAGKAVQNTTFMHHGLNFHVIPGQALTTDQIAKGGRQLTRANETLYFWKGPGWVVLRVGKLSCTVRHHLLLLASLMN